MVQLAERAPGISAFVADGAFRGTHIGGVQNDTGCPVIFASSASGWDVFDAEHHPVAAHR